MIFFISILKVQWSSLECCLKRLLLLSFFTSCTGAIYFLWNSPVAFQKTNIIRFVDFKSISKQTPTKWINIEKVIGNIPYTRNTKTVYSIQPHEKYKKTVIQGKGNCSNYVFGLAHFLVKQKYTFQVVFMLPPDTFLFGLGHTSLSMPYTLSGKRHLGIVDVFEGGIPIHKNQPIKLQTLTQSVYPSISIRPLHPKHDTKSPYYPQGKSPFIIGIERDVEVKRYFNFIHSTYVPLGHQKLEKLVYETLSLLLGFSPKIYIDSHKKNQLFKTTKHIYILGKITLFSMRSFFILLGLFGMMYLGRVFWIWKRTLREDAS